jgi:hypothetical protein
MEEEKKEKDGGGNWTGDGVEGGKCEFGLSLIPPA